MPPAAGDRGGLKTRASLLSRETRSLGQGNRPDAAADAPTGGSPRSRSALSARGGNGSDRVNGDDSAGGGARLPPRLASAGGSGGSGSGLKGMPSSGLGVAKEGPPLVRVQRSRGQQPDVVAAAASPSTAGIAPRTAATTAPTRAAAGPAGAAAATAAAAEGEGGTGGGAGGVSGRSGSGCWMGGADGAEGEAEEGVAEMWELSAEALLGPEALEVPMLTLGSRCAYW